MQTDLFADENALSRAIDIHDWCLREGAKILYPGHADYPFNGGWIEKPPPFMCYWGRPAWREAACLSVVGSREPSRMALEWLEAHLSEFLRRTGAVTVSGGARGIDQKAHALSLRAGRPTVVFLPSGLARPYPDEWRQWKDEVVAAGGAIVSIHAPWQEIRRSHFEERNRLIAALGRMTFVVEARRKSGSVMTARLANEIGKDICCLPGSPLDPRCGGTLDLICASSAVPIRDACDLEAAFSRSCSRVEVSAKLGAN